MIPFSHPSTKRSSRRTHLTGEASRPDVGMASPTVHSVLDSLMGPPPSPSPPGQVDIPRFLYWAHVMAGDMLASHGHLEATCPAPEDGITMAPKVYSPPSAEPRHKVGGCRCKPLCPRSTSRHLPGSATRSQTPPSPLFTP